MVLILFLLQTVHSGQSESSFRTAIVDKSTAPYFVIVTVVGGSSGRSQEIFTEAPFLLGAIHIERGIPFDDRRSQRVRRTALSTKDRIFHFSNRKALCDIPMPYSGDVLAATRKWAAGFLIDELTTDLSRLNSPVDEYYSSRKGDDYLAHKLALAHALIERGLVVRRGCVVDDLLVDRE